MKHVRVFVELLIMVMLLVACVESVSGSEATQNVISEAVADETGGNLPESSDPAETEESEIYASELLTARELEEFEELIQWDWTNRSCPEIDGGEISYIVYADTVEKGNYFLQYKLSAEERDMAYSVERDDFGYLRRGNLHLVTEVIGYRTEEIGRGVLEASAMEKKYKLEFPEKDIVFQNYWDMILNNLFGEGIPEDLTQNVEIFVSGYDRMSYDAVQVKAALEDTLYHWSTSVKRNAGEGNAVYQLKTTNSRPADVFTEQVRAEYAPLAEYRIYGSVEIEDFGENQNWQSEGKKEYVKAKSLFNELIRRMGRFYCDSNGGALGTMRGEIYVMNRLDESLGQMIESWICLEGREPRQFFTKVNYGGAAFQSETTDQTLEESVKADAVMVLRVDLTTEQKAWSEPVSTYTYHIEELDIDLEIPENMYMYKIKGLYRDWNDEIVTLDFVDFYFVSLKEFDEEYLAKGFIENIERERSNLFFGFYLIPTEMSPAERLHTPLISQYLSGDGVRWFDEDYFCVLAASDWWTTGQMWQSYYSYMGESAEVENKYLIPGYLPREEWEQAICDVTDSGLLESYEYDDFMRGYSDSLEKYTCSMLNDDWWSLYSWAVEELKTNPEPYSYEAKRELRWYQKWKEANAEKENCYTDAERDIYLRAYYYAYLVTIGRAVELEDIAVMYEKADNGRDRYQCIYGVSQWNKYGSVDEGPDYMVDLQKSYEYISSVRNK